MADEQEAAQPTAEAPAQEQPAADTPPERDWDTLLNEAPDEILAKHRRVQGIAGSHADRLYQKRQRESDAQRQAEAQDKAREELRKMAQDKPLEFADMFLSHDEAEQARNRIANVERNAAKQMMERIGKAYHDLDEWANLSEEETTKLRQAVEGASDDDALPKFNKVALEIVADRRAEKRLADRLTQEKSAWRKEWEAERLASEQGPDLRRPSSTKRQKVSWSAMSDEDFDKYWRQKYG